MYSSLSSPIPCSPVMVPHAATHAAMISRTAARALVLIVRVVADVRVEISVTGMKHVAYRDALAVSDRTNGRQHIGEARTRDHGVLHDQMRRHAPHRAERLLPALPEPRPLGVI